MIMLVQAYLDFNGRCEEALNFYKKAVGAEVTMLMRFKESPDQSMCAPGSGEKVMHSALRVGDTVLMATDGHNQGKPNFSGISLSITAKDGKEAEKVFNALSDGGQVMLPLQKTFFASHFGMASDKFGVSWMVIAGQQQ
jgi:PhnB protein